MAHRTLRNLGTLVDLYLYLVASLSFGGKKKMPSSNLKISKADNFNSKCYLPESPPFRRRETNDRRG